MVAVLPKIKVSVTIENETESFFKIDSSKKASEIIRTIFNQDTFLWREEFFLICLNNSNEVIGYYKLSEGGITGTVVDVRMLFNIALKLSCTGILICHNHPSGKLIPSDADINITNKIKTGCGVFDISLVDHLIITKDGYYSFNDEGRL